ncbi:hypothetical protein D9615_000944 [Tricholomella constricta]|uniref:Mid2 domain-containing protein n=1 Tax=Tricholomella constricta TaxID=117010 RepID=A0A8H5M860_9AGAR|nr:hypothetical protein D9615_000944 [Tricholomella constricta]
MQNHALSLVFTSFGLSVMAQALTLTVPNGPTVVQMFTTNENGPTGLTIKPLTGHTPPVSTPFPNSSKFSSNSSNTSRTAGPSDSSPQRTSAGTIAGIVVAVVTMLSFSLALFFFFKRRKRRRRRGSVKVELDLIGSPLADKFFTLDPFLTDNEVKGLGYDASQQATRRIEAKFLPISQRASSDAQSTDTSAPSVPRILLTREGEIMGRPITPSSPGNQASHNLSGHTSSTQYSLDVKSTLVPTATRGSSPESHPEGSLSATASSQADVARRMRDLLAQMEHHVATPVS